jgi:hypothetical protein
MPIAINGSGTISGISAGGLPDGVVDTDVIAANAVTTAKLGTSEASGLCKAWVSFNGEGTVAIRSSYNVSSITDNGTGLYTVNFSTTFADTNYALATSTVSFATTTGTANTAVLETDDGANRTTSSAQFRTQLSTGANIDRAVVNVAAFR